MTDVNTTKRTYVFTCLLSPTLDKETAEKMCQELKAILKGEDREVMEDVKEMGLVPYDLAYEINGHGRALVAAFEFQTHPRLLVELHQALRNQRHVLRYAVTKKHHAVKPTLRRAMPRSESLNGRPSAPPIASSLNARIASPEPPSASAPLEAITAEDIDKKLEEIIG